MQTRISRVMTGAPLASACVPSSSPAKPLGIPCSAEHSLSVSSLRSTEAGHSDTQAQPPRATASRQTPDFSETPGAPSSSLQPAAPPGNLDATGSPAESIRDDPSATADTGQGSHTEAPASTGFESLGPRVSVPCSGGTGPGLNAAEMVSEASEFFQQSGDSTDVRAATHDTGVSEPIKAQQCSSSDLVPAPDSPLGLRSAVASNGCATSMRGESSRRVESPVDSSSMQRDISSTAAATDTFGHPQDALRDLMNVMHAAGTRDPTSTSSDFRPAKVTISDQPVATEAVCHSPAEFDEAIEAVAVEPVPMSPAGEPAPGGTEASMSAVDKALANASAEWQRRCVNAGDDLAEWRLPSSVSPAAGAFPQLLHICLARESVCTASTVCQCDLTPASSGTVDLDQVGEMPVRGYFQLYQSQPIVAWPSSSGSL